jgi:hypothetical protein
MAGTLSDKTIVQFKSMFFDAEKILNAAGKAIVKNLNYIGGYVAKVARHSIKKGSSHAVSKSGTKPLSHTGLLKKHIYYGYNPMHESVIVGPAYSIPRVKMRRQPWNMVVNQLHTAKKENENKCKGKAVYESALVSSRVRLRIFGKTVLGIGFGLWTLGLGKNVYLKSKSKNGL